MILKFDIYDTAMLQTRVQEYVEFFELKENNLLFLLRITITNRGKVSFNYAWQIYMEDNQRPFTPMIERDPPTPEPTDSQRKTQKGGARTQPGNVSTNDSFTTQESPTGPATTRGKDKSTKDTGKLPTKDGQTTNKGKNCSFIT